MDLTVNINLKPTANAESTVLDSALTVKQGGINRLAKKKQKPAAPDVDHEVS